MANYNPHAPAVIGNEWVPIRQENYQPDEITERGYEFYLDNSTIIVSGSNSIADVPTALSTNKIMLNAIYPAGQEDKTGPVRQVTIPCDGVTITGAGVTAFTNDFLTPTDDSSALLNNLASGNGIGLSFDLSSYSAQLSGKRILNVELLYTANGEPSDLAQMRVDISRAAASFPSGQTFPYQLGLEGAPFEVPVTRIATVQFKDVTSWWSTSVNPTFGTLPLEVFPWRYDELALLDASAGAGKLQVSIWWVDSVNSVSSIFINYAALRVTYCEETRVLYGSRMPAALGALPDTVMRHRFLNTSFQHAVTSLGPGNYVLTSTFRSLSNQVIDSQLGEDTTTPWTLYAQRQLYELSTLPGVLVESTKEVNAEFVSGPTDVLPQTMMYTSAAIVTGSHAYGKQLQAPIYGSVNATQALNGLRGISGSTSGAFNQARFYARRYGSQTAPLTLGTVGGLYLPGVAGSYASTPNVAALNITTDLDLRFEGTMDWTPTVAGALVAKWNEPANQRSYLFYNNPTGTIGLAWSNDGTTVLGGFNSTVAVPMSFGRLAVRVTLDVDNGAAGRTITFYTSDSINGTWTQLGTQLIQAGVTSIFNGTAVLETGAHSSGTLSVADGIVHTLQVLNGIGGTQVANPNFEAQATGTTVFVDAAGRTWTVNGNAKIVGDTSLAVLTAEELDDLPEIIDGWREVTKTLTTPITFTTPDTRISWESTGTPVGSQWQILGTDGPSLASTFASGIASYAPPEGQPLNLTWKGPNQTITTGDENADAVLMFSSAAPAVTGISISQCTVAVTGIGAACNGAAPYCIPTHILGHQLTWQDPDVIRDTFSRVLVDSWGSTDTGQAWNAFTGLTNQYDVTGTEGTITPTATNINTVINFDALVSDYEAQVTLTNNVIPTGASIGAYGFATRWTDDNNYYRMVANIDTAGVVTAFISSIVGGVTNILANATTSVSATTDILAKVYVVGVVLKLKLWNVGDPEPQDWTLEVSNGNHLTSTRVGLVFRRDTGNLTPLTVGYDDFVLYPDGVDHIEIQRMDTVEPDWQQIARLSPRTLSFCDFEARAGVLSSYRLRTVNELGFAGAWSTDITRFLASPGVSGVGDGNSVLILTSNQDVNASLAYVMNWEGEPVEQFSFPEAGFQQLRTQYGRDFFIAFRPNERGGEQFSRTILVQAAAITPESLADFRSLRDLAWQELPYVCVRDELGNRWFANIAVPTGRVRNNRTLYLAEMNITEVTDTSAPVVE